MLVLCPPALAVTLAFILRGFRRRQTLGTGVVLVAAFVSFRAISMPNEGVEVSQTLPLPPL